jgi:hypothetical protein
VGAGAESRGNIEAGGEVVKVVEGPVLVRAAGKGVDDGEVFDGFMGNDDSWFGDAGDGDRGEEREGEMTDGVAEIVAIAAVPGVDGVEGGEAGERAGVVGEADEVEAGVRDGSGAVGELD